MVEVKKFPRKPIYVLKSVVNPRILASIWQIKGFLFVSLAKFVWRSDLQRYKATNNFAAEELLVVSKLAQDALELLEMLYEDYPAHIRTNKRIPVYNSVKNQKLRLYLKARMMVPFDTEEPTRSINVLEVAESPEADLSESVSDKHGQKDSLVSPSIFTGMMQEQAQKDFDEKEWEDEDDTKDPDPNPSS